MNFPNLDIVVMVQGTNYYSPLSIDVYISPNINHKAFKFINSIDDHPNFLPKVQLAWKNGHNNSLKRYVGIINK